VNDLKEFLGWGFRSKGVPAGEKANTYLFLSRLLFGQAVGESVTENSLALTLKYFHRLFIFGMLVYVKSWTEIKATYLEFPQVQRAAKVAMEESIATMRSARTLENSIVKLAKELFNVDLGGSSIRTHHLRASTNDSSESKIGHLRRLSMHVFDSPVNSSTELKDGSTPDATPLLPSKSVKKSSEAPENGAPNSQPVRRKKTKRVLSGSSDDSEAWKDTEAARPERVEDPSDSQTSEEDDALRNTTEMKPPLDSVAAPSSTDILPTAGLENTVTDHMEKERLPIVAGENQSAYDLLITITPKTLANRHPVPKLLREEERKWVGNLVRAQILVLQKLREKGYQVLTFHCFTLCNLYFLILKLCNR